MHDHTLRFALAALSLTACMTEVGEKADGCVSEVEPVQTPLLAQRLTADDVRASRLLSAFDVCGRVTRIDGTIRNAAATTKSLLPTSRQEGGFMGMGSETVTRWVELPSPNAWQLQIPTSCRAGADAGSCVTRIAFGATSSIDGSQLVSSGAPSRESYPLSAPEDLPILSALADIVCDFDGNNPTESWGSGDLYNQRGTGSEVIESDYTYNAPLIRTSTDAVDDPSIRVEQIILGLETAMYTFDVQDWSCTNRSDKLE